MAITVHEVAEARGLNVDHDGASSIDDYAGVGLAMLGGCHVCAASIAAYNAYPGRNGYWHCGDCIEGDGGFETVEEFEADVARADIHRGSRA